MHEAKGEQLDLALEKAIDKWPVLSSSARVEVFRSLPPEEAHQFFMELSAREQTDLLLELPQGERRLWFRLLPPDDAADVIQEADPGERIGLLNLLDESTRREVVALMAYQEDVAGGLMNPRFTRLRPDMTADEAISYLRHQAAEVETVYVGYVLDYDQRLLGVVSFRELFAAPRHKRVRDIMRTDFVYATEEQDQESVAKLFTDHHLLAIPVLDDQGRMKGIVTLDDIVEVVEEEASEDIQKIGGMAALDAPYMETGFWRMVRKRGGWLAVLFLGEMLTATAMAYYEEEISRAVILAMFIPLIISSGGNSGSQAATLVIRAMAVEEIRLRDWWRVAGREISAGLVLGTLLGSIGFTRIMLWEAVAHPYGQYAPLVATTVFLSLIGVVMFGTTAGSMLPFILRRLRFDPATASAPFVATLVDVTGLVIYFTVASIILAGTLL
ncbi:MAG: magnesium transporter [Bryobacteraceae bacterium]